MASAGLELGEVQPPPEPPQPELAFTEAQKWIEQVTGRSFGEKDFRSGLENGILLCELLNAIKPGLVKKINRLPTPIAGLDNIILFLRGCKELGLKESQLFDPGDLQDTSNRVTIKNIDYSRKLKNVLVTIYWLGKVANNCTSYSGSTLNLKEFEGLLAQMRKETEDIESPKRSIRDSGYIDCWDSERSDSLSPPRHGRDDSFDSLDSFGSRSQQTPSPDVVLRGSSDGRGSDSETDLPHRKMPDVKKDDMLARRTSHGEPKSAVPFNQYLPNKSNQTFYVPAPLRKKKAEREDYRKSWSTATSPLGDRPFSKPHPETIEEEQNETSGLCEKEKVGSMAPEASSLKSQVGLNQNEGNSIEQSPLCSAKETSAPKGRDAEEIRKLRRLEQAGIKVMSAAQRYGSKKQTCEDNRSIPDIILRKDNPFMIHYQGKDSGSEDEAASRVPDLEKDDFATRRARMNQPKPIVPFNSFLIGSYTSKDKGKLEDIKKPLQMEKQEHARRRRVHMVPARQIATSKENPLLQTEKTESEKEQQVKGPDTERDDLTKQKSQNTLPQLQEDVISVNASITKADLETWKRLKLSGESSTVTQEESQEQPEIPQQQSSGTENEVKLPDPQRDDMLARRTGAFLKQPGPNVKQFLPMPFSKQKNKQGTDRELETKIMRPEKSPQVCINSSAKPIIQPLQEEQHGQEKCNLPSAVQDETICTAQVGECSLNEEHLDHTSKLQEVPEENKTETLSSKDEHLQTFGSRAPVSDDAESMSMFDMRCEEEAVTQPHSKARHEKLQNIHNQLKEDETRWQDDLARWKSRRRSASQDLIKKEAERKKMERLLSGEGTNERRKSIKTYREIVEEKERRERELHEAYKNAKSQEEAESILQQYIERFTISEAVLERLQMPKILERSHSVEPNSPLKDPNPLRYLRQQSLPAPKFTATIEATIVPTTELEPSGSTGPTSPSKSVVSKAVPMLTPKPYSQPKNTQEVLKNFKVDGKVNMNGENVNGVDEKDKECTTVIFTPSPSRSLKFDGVARGDRPSVELKKDPSSVELSLQRPATQSVHKEPTASPVEADKASSQQVEASPGNAGPVSLACPSPGSDQKQFKSTAACASPVVKRLEFLPSPVSSEEAVLSEKDVKKPEMEQQKEAELPATVEMTKPKALEQEGSVVLPFLKKLPETSQVTLQNSVLQEPPRWAAVPLRVRNNWRRSQFFSQSADSDNGDKSNRFNFWSWDPEEERKRQERWQHEQERLLQEKYQKEQDKLKQEWEKAQREVEEEERRYYEEERKIIEDTVVPFIVSSNSAELLSSSSSTTEGNKTVNTTDSNSSPEEGKQKEVTRQKKLLWEQDSISSSKSNENELWQEKRSGNKVLSGRPETGILKGGEQEHQVPMMERSSPARLNLPLTQDVSWNQQFLTKQSPHRAENIWQRQFLGQSAGQQPCSAGEVSRAGYHENFRSGPSSPCSPAAPSHSPNRYKRSVSGKKLCSTCGLPLGKGAAMIIETLGLYFHIQCFRCGICKGQLGDTTSGTDVRIRNGLLNCNDCYIRSRTAGQPTTL
ncbi:LIM and calponin homology domains-containing protein 1 isoform X7 [Cuculus canorus]|uniref:LIM and calponin homology domains-containing protein 1 isoform X7 n=1 Tax=Cuculus canorus TaxID=55661 RepID=UPI0023AA80F8|nr:LIM and calponin homology domains-containing protein 1 isoform X7 [Cuculus canorus]